MPPRISNLAIFFRIILSNLIFDPFLAVSRQLSDFAFFCFFPREARDLDLVPDNHHHHLTHPPKRDGEQQFFLAPCRGRAAATFVRDSFPGTPCRGRAAGELRAGSSTPVKDPRGHKLRLSTSNMKFDHLNLDVLRSRKLISRSKVGII